MTRYSVEFFFSKRCITRGWTIEADSADTAEALAQSCIDKHGQLDDAKAKEVGLEFASWDTLNDDEGTDWEFYAVEAQEPTA